MRALAPSMAAAVDRRGGRRRRRRSRPRDGRDGDGLLRGRRARARRRHLRHRVAQPEGVHRDEDRPARRAAGRRRLRPRGDPEARAGRLRPVSRGAGRSARRTSGRASSSRSSRSSTSRRSALCASSSTRRTAWPARCSRRARAAPAVDVVRCYFEPDGTFPNHEPNPLLPENREFIVAKSARRAPTSASRSTAMPTAASSSTTPASSCPATS